MFNLFDRLRSDEENAKIEAEQAAKDLQEAMAKLPPEELLRVQEEVFMENLARVEDVVNGFVLTARQAQMGLNTVDDFRAVAKRIEKTIAFSDYYKEMPKEVRDHMKTYLVHVLELVIASFNSHK